SGRRKESDRKPVENRLRRPTHPHHHRPTTPRRPSTPRTETRHPIPSQPTNRTTSTQPTPTRRTHHPRTRKPRTHSPLPPPPEMATQPIRGRSTPRRHRNRHGRMGSRGSRTGQDTPPNSASIDPILQRGGV